LDSLDPKERLVLTLREVQGLSYEELAGALKISLEAVKSRLRRARETLRDVGATLFDASHRQTC
jgi:RNA polymerase sigma-70 factor (ECF subfamily)